MASNFVLTGKTDIQDIRNSFEVLKRDLNDFKQKVQSSNSEIGTMSNKVSSAKGAFTSLSSGVGSVVPQLKALAAAGLTVQTAIEGFNRVMESSQTLGDQWSQMVSGMEGVLNSFFETLTNGDWSNFFSNAERAFELSKQANIAKDIAGDNEEYYNNIKSKHQRVLSEQKLIINDPNKSAEEKRIAEEIIKRSEKNLEKQLNEYAKKKEDEATATFRSSYSAAFASRLTKEDFEQTLRDATGQSKELEDYKKRKAALTEKAEQSIRVSKKIGTNAISIVDPKKKAEAEKAQQQLKQLQNDNRHLEERIYRVENLSDDERKQVNQLYITANALRTEGADLKNQRLKLSNKVDKPTPPIIPKVVTPRVKVEKPTYDAGTIRDLQEQIKEITNTLSSKNLTEEVQKELVEKKEGLQIKLDELQIALGLKTPQKVEVEPIIPEGSLAFLQKQMKDLEAKLNVTVIDSPEYELLKSELDELKYKEHLIKVGFEEDALKETKSELHSLQSEMQLVTSTFGAIGNSFSTIGNLIEGEGGKFVSAIGTMMSSISSIIPALTALSVANQNVAVTGAAASSSWLGPVGVIASITSVIGAFASLATIPKFESGGIVGGTSYYDDKVLSRLNSGEMVLNRHQQANLFNQLNNPNRIPQTPSGEVTFRISGNQLVGVLNNYNKTNRRII